MEEVRSSSNRSRANLLVHSRCRFKLFVTAAATCLLLHLPYCSCHQSSGSVPELAIFSRGGSDGSRDDLHSQRITYVKSMLIDRLNHVESGKRISDFAKWVRERGGEATVFSMHGVDSGVDFSQQVLNPDESSSSEHKNILARKDPFPADRMNLDVPVDIVPSAFQGKQVHLIGDHRANLVQLMLRAIVLLVSFAPILSTALLAFFFKAFRLVWYKWVAASLGKGGAAFIKWGQWASTRSDMFPEALCDQLELLQAEAPAHSWGWSEKSMESTLGIPRGSLLQVFDSFDRTPLASGSIAQVHKASIGGKLVAVKIRHPNVAKLIDLDFRIMTIMARIFDVIPALSWLHIRDSVEQFSHTMAAQAHLQVEGHHLEILNHNFRNWPTVNFPHPFYASSAVIIETFEPGTIVSTFLDTYYSEADRINAQPKVEEAIDGKEETSMEVSSEVTGSSLIPLFLAQFIVTTGVALYMKMLLVDNLMHADLHPGNILIRADKKNSDLSKALSIVEDGLASATDKDSHIRPDKRAHLKVTLVDAGMVAKLTDEESDTFIGILASLGEGDGRAAGNFALRFSLENNMNEEQKEAFVQDMIELFKERCRGYGTNVDVGHVLRGILSLIRDHQVRVDANFATLVVNCLCIEGMARRVCPAYNVLDGAKPLLQSYYKRRFQADGTPKEGKVIKSAMPLMYLQKEKKDKAFFRRLGENQ